MRVKITAGGIYGAEGKEIPIGTELVLENEPTGWAGRYEILSADEQPKKSGKTALTNPAGSGKLTEALAAVLIADGTYSIAKGDEVFQTGLTEQLAGAFNALSEDEKVAHVAELTKSNTKPAPVGPFEAKDKGEGWWAVFDAKGEQVGKSIRKADGEAFNGLSDDDKAAYVAELTKD